MPFAPLTKPQVDVPDPFPQRLAAAGEPVALALFASARSLFPGSPELVAQLVPPIARVPASLARRTLVMIGLDHDHEETVSCAVGLSIA